MRMVMMGTGPFAVPTFRGLFESHHAVVSLITGPLKQRGKRAIAINPMRDVANEHGTPIFDPEDVNDLSSRAKLTGYEADLLVVCDYGQILSADTLATSRLGGVNLHASLLPKYRGAAPINWAIYDGEPQTGVSVIHMTPRVDAGPVIAQGRTPIEPDETAQELEVRLADIGAWFVTRAIDLLEAGNLQALPQNPALASQAPRIKKTDGLIDWGRPATAIHNHVRAMEPWPKTYTFWHRPSGAPMRLILGPVTVVDDPHCDGPHCDAPPGTVLGTAEDHLTVATGEGTVTIENLQPAGKRMMPVGEFLRGHQIRAGERLGSE